MSKMNSQLTIFITVAKSFHFIANEENILLEFVFVTENMQYYP